MISWPAAWSRTHGCRSPRTRARAARRRRRAARRRTPPAQRAGQGGASSSRAARRRHGTRYIAEVAELARHAPPGEARTLVLDVIDNHDNLKLGLPGGLHDHPPPPLPTATDFTPRSSSCASARGASSTSVLIPNEELAERSGGKIPDELVRRIKREAIEARPVRRPARARARRPGLDARPSGSSWRSSSGARPTRCRGTCPAPTTCWPRGTPEQIERYLKPALRGELHDAYAVTEAEAGSDPSRIETTARAHATAAG